MWRIIEILKARNITDSEIEIMLDNVTVDDVPYDYPTSSLKCYFSDGSNKTLFSLNHKVNNYILTRFDLPHGCVKCEFIPQNDIDGYVKLFGGYIGKEKVLDEIVEQYYGKNVPVKEFNIEKGSDSKFIAKWSISPFN